MHIAIDARNLLTDHSGIGRSLLEICRELSRRDAAISLYWPNKPSLVPRGICSVTNYFSGYHSVIGRQLWSATALPRQIEAGNPDIFWGPSHRIPINLNPKIPCVVTIHDLVWAKYPQTMRRSGWLADRILAPHAMKRADAIIAVSNATGNDIIERYPQWSHKIHVIHPGPSEFALENGVDDPLLDMDEDFALFVGTIEPRKNLENLLIALAMLKRSGQVPGKLYVAGGDGWRHQNINGLIARHNLTDCVLALGFVNDTDLGELYRRARFLAMPSLYEGFGLPIIEAGQYGVPSLTSNTSSMPEAAGKAGLLVNPLDPTDIANGWRRLWEDETLYAKLRDQARPNTDRFSWSSNVEATLGLFESLIRGTNDRQ